MMYSTTSVKENLRSPRQELIYTLNQFLNNSQTCFLKVRAPKVDSPLRGTYNTRVERVEFAEDFR